MLPMCNKNRIWVLLTAMASYGGLSCKRSFHGGHVLNDESPLTTLAIPLNVSRLTPGILGPTLQGDLTPTEGAGTRLIRISAEKVGLARRSCLSRVLGGLGARRETDRSRGTFRNQDVRDATVPPYTPGSAAIERVLGLAWSHRCPHAQDPFAQSPTDSPRWTRPLAGLCTLGLRA